MKTVQSHLSALDYELIQASEPARQAERESLGFGNVILPGDKLVDAPAIALDGIANQVAKTDQTNIQYS